MEDRHVIEEKVLLIHSLMEAFDKLYPDKDPARIKEGSEDYCNIQKALFIHDYIKDLVGELVEYMDLT
ncbi:MAG: hypothetical protein Q4E34_00325 [Synergistaceae bacterium]|nr:hypothetical protein [Synergistaceae bacterium]